MKTAIKLVLIDLVIAQIVAPVLIMIPCTIYLLVTTGNLDKAVLTQTIIIPAQLSDNDGYLSVEGRLHQHKERDLVTCVRSLSFR